VVKDEVTHRTAVRIILVDPAEKVLLIGSRNSDDGRVVWIMPGGGIEEGESVHEAAARELFEETGIQVAPSAIEGPVWTRSHRFSWQARLFDYREWFVVARLERPHVVTPFAANPAEAANVVGIEWVDLPALRRWPDLVAPRRLAELLPPIFAGELPAEPIDTGI
jgi:8-oxo-dGTP pyrophosphatase MutT (NUDIX family)